MKDLKNWMVGLDLSDHDEHLIKYTYDLSNIFKPDEIVFSHIKTRNEIPDRFKTVEDDSREEILEQIKAKVTKVFKDQKNVKCEVHEGTPHFDLWRETFLHHTDLFLVGEKNIRDGRKLVPEKFVRKSFCSVLFVPPVTQPIKKIWVPIDFSESSKDAIEFAVQIREHCPGSSITCHYIFETPSIDLVDSELRKEYVDYFRNESAKQFKDYIEKVPNSAKIDIKLTPWLYADVADHVKEEAEEALADIIIMSSGGKTRITSLFLGSSTSELIKLEKKIPLVILKQKINRVTAWDILTHL